MIENSKKDLSKQWRLINETLQRGGKTKKSINELATEENEILTGDENIFNELNNFFTNNSSTMVSKIPTSQKNSKTYILQNITSSVLIIFFFFFKRFSENGIFRKILHSNDEKAVEIETIPNKKNKSGC